MKRKLAARMPDPPWLALIAGASWTAVCLAVIGWDFLASRDPRVCAPAGDYVIFCQAHQADILLTHIAHVGVIFGLGVLVIASLAAVLRSSHPACMDCGAHRRTPDGRCVRCGHGFFPLTLKGDDALAVHRAGDAASSLM